MEHTIYHPAAQDRRAVQVNIRAGLKPYHSVSSLRLLSCITDAAAALGVSRFTLAELVNAKRGVSPEIAIRLSKGFGGSAESWLT